MTRITILTAAATSTLLVSLMAVSSLGIESPLTGDAIGSAATPCVTADCSGDDLYDLNSLVFGSPKVTRTSAGLRLDQPSENEWSEIVDLVDSIEDADWTAQAN